jgi:hypothetical protein
MFFMQRHFEINGNVLFTKSCKEMVNQLGRRFSKFVQTIKNTCSKNTVLYLPYFKNVTNFVGHEQEVVSGGKEF